METKGSTLGLIELVGTQDLKDAHGTQTFELLRDEYISRVKNWIRSSDQSRLLNSNRICVVLKGVNNSAQIQLAAAKLSRIFMEPYSLLGDNVRMQVIVGFVPFDPASDDLKTFIRLGGKAVRHAKLHSKEYEVYGPHCETSGTDEQELVTKLELAVELGEFELYFQPKIHAGFGTVSGAEALMRWHTKDRKVILPGMFINVAERHSVIKPMTWWAIKTAVARLARWPENLAIAVNVTPTLLLDDETFLVVQDSLEIHGVTPSRLTLEVTESIMVDNPQAMMLQLKRFRNMGVKISIDDFGTGFSSMLYFRDLPADEIKIDQSFVMPMCRSKKDHAIVKSIIELAHNFSLRVVAEGVEDEETAAELAIMKCDLLQGFLFDKALLPEDFEKRYIN